MIAKGIRRKIIRLNGTVHNVRSCFLPAAVGCLRIGECENLIEQLISMVVQLQQPQLQQSQLQQPQLQQPQLRQPQLQQPQLHKPQLQQPQLQQQPPQLQQQPPQLQQQQQPPQLHHLPNSCKFDLVVLVSSILGLASIPPICFS